LAVVPLPDKGGVSCAPADGGEELEDPDPDDVFVFRLFLHCGERGLLRVEVFAVFVLTPLGVLGVFVPVREHLEPRFLGDFPVPLARL